MTGQAQPREVATAPEINSLSPWERARGKGLSPVIGTKIVIPCHRIRHSRGSGNPEGKGGTNHIRTHPTTKSHFHTLVCRHQPAWAIGTKACPGLRSGMDGFRHDRWSRHAGVPLEFPRTRHSGEGRNPGKAWAASMTLELSHQPAHLIFKPWCAGASRNPAPVHVPELTL